MFHFTTRLQYNILPPGLFLKDFFLLLIFIVLYLCVTFTTFLIFMSPIMKIKLHAQTNWANRHWKYLFLFLRMFWFVIWYLFNYPKAKKGHIRVCQIKFTGVFSIHFVMLFCLELTLFCLIQHIWIFSKRWCVVSLKF